MLLTAAVWGFGFVAQRAGMEHVGPFTYNGVRFALGACSLLPLLFLGRRGRSKRETPVPAGQETNNGGGLISLILSGMLAGAVLFLAASFQQVGLLYTTAGNAGFITGLYVIIVPLFGLFFRHRPGKGVWIGAVLAVCGLYLLSSVQGLMTARGDFLEVICAVLFACHVLIIGRLSPRYPAVPLSIVQFLVCSLLCTLVALGWEEMVWQEILDAAVPILYGGVCSVGIAYTLQVVGQKDAPPGHAAIILSLESAFAFFGGWLLLNEPATARTLSGAGLILAGMLVAQTQRVLAMKKKRRQDGSDAVV